MKKGLSAGENGYGGHSTVVFCGGEHPRFWRTGCCEGAGSCTSDCELDYSCFSAIGPDAEIHHFVFNNDGSPLFSWVDKSYKIAPVYAVSSDESFFYFGVDDPQSLFDLPEKEKDPMVRAIVGMTMGSDEISKDFPWLVKIAFN